ncbi:MAG: hypothetical protein J7L07_04480, partial [Candidatus Odinarchaeota archaeon]|nr:hypothetical protein [Candidatus Odinarchaeota archaeon]
MDDTLLNVSQTDNNTFFLKLFTSVANKVFWWYVDDSTNGDNSTSYVDDTFYEIDFVLNVSLAFFTKTPKPSDLALKVNETEVLDNFTWISSDFFFSESVYFDVSSLWPILEYNVTYSLYENQTLYARSEYTLSDETVTWTTQFQTNLSFVFSKINATMSHPSDWTFQYALNYSTMYPYYETYPSRTKIYWDYGNGKWKLYYVSNNYLSQLLIDPSPALITDIIDISAKFREGTNPTSDVGTLRIYHNLIQIYTDQDYPNQGWLNFSWLPASTIDEGGNFTINVLWENGTEVGYVSGNMYIMLTTSLVSLYDDTKINLIGDTVEVKVRYFDTHNNEPIEGANVTGKWFYNDSVKFTDIGNGYYVAYLDTSNAKNGTYPLNITATKFGYQLQNVSASIKLIYKTRLTSHDYIANFTIPMTIAANFTFENGTAITGANVTINGTKMQDNLNGTYTYQVKFNSLGTYMYVINATKEGYQSQSITIQVCVCNISTYLEGTPLIEIEYSDSIAINVTYKMYNGTYIEDATVKLEINGTEYPCKELGYGKYGVYIHKNFTLGTYELTFTLQKYGFSVSQYTTFLIVNPISTTANTFNGSTTFNVMYHETFILIVNYTFSNGSPINDGNVYATPSYNPSQVIVASNIGNGQYSIIVYVESAYNFSLTVKFERQFCKNHTLVINFKVSARPIGYSISYPTSTSAGYEFNLTLWVYDNKTNEYLTNVTLDISFTGNNSIADYTIITIDNYYNITFVVNNRPSTNVTFQVNIKTGLLGFMNESIDTTILIYSVKTNAYVEYPHSIFYGDNTIIKLYYGPFDANIQTNWSNYDVNNLNNGTYLIILNTSKLELGNYSVKILAFRENYVNYSIIVNFTVVRLPAKIIFSPANEVLWNDTIEIYIYLFDEHHNEYVENFSISTDIPDSEIINMTQYFIIRINTANYALGKHTFYVNATKPHYENTSLALSFNVKPRRANIIVPETIKHYVNNTITIKASIVDLNSSIKIINANLTLKIFGNTYHFEEKLPGEYEVSIFLNNTGKFNGTICFEMKNYVNESIPIMIHVLERATVTFYLSTVGDPIAGQRVGVNVTAIFSNGTPAANIPLTVIVTYEFENGTTKSETVNVVTNEEGQAIFDVSIPNNVKSMQISVSYEGNFSTLSSTNEANFTVIRPISLLDYWWLFALFGLFSAISYVTYRTKKKRSYIKLMVQIKTKELYSELASIKHYLLIHSGGVLMYYKSYIAKSLHAELLSGIITALTTVSTQVLETKEKSRYSMHTYSGLSITVVHGDFVLTAFISNKPLSTKMINRIYYILKILERKHYNVLKNWAGAVADIEPFAKQLEQELAIPIVHLELEVVKLGKKYASIQEKIRRLVEEGKKVTIANLIPLLTEKEASMLHELLMKKKIRFKTNHKKKSS